MTPERFFHYAIQVWAAVVTVITIMLSPLVLIYLACRRVMTALGGLRKLISRKELVKKRVYAPEIK